MRAIIFPCNLLVKLQVKKAQSLDHVAGFKSKELGLLPAHLQFSYFAPITRISLVIIYLLVFKTRRVPVKLELDVACFSDVVHASEG